MINIVGNIGSGKKEIEQEFRKNDNIIVINLDDIDDFNFVNLFRTDKKFYKDVSENKKNNWTKILEKENKKIINQYIKMSKKESRILVVICLPHHNNIINYIEWTTKFYIDTDIEQLYRRSCTKILERLHKNHHELIEMLKHQPKLYTIKSVSFFKMRIKDLAIIPYDEFIGREKSIRTKYKNLGYKIISSNKIIKMII